MVSTGASQNIFYLLAAKAIFDRYLDDNQISPSKYRLFFAARRALGCDFFERVGEKRIDIRRFFGYVCPFAKVWVRIISDGSLFSPKIT